MRTTAHGGWIATHKHPTYGFVKAIYTQQGKTRISDGWRAVSVPTDELTDLNTSFKRWPDDEEGGIVTLNRS